MMGLLRALWSGGHRKTTASLAVDRREEAITEERGRLAVAVSKFEFRNRQLRELARDVDRRLSGSP